MLRGYVTHPDNVIALLQDTLYGAISMGRPLLDGVIQQDVIELVPAYLPRRTQDGDKEFMLGIAGQSP